MALLTAKLPTAPKETASVSVDPRCNAAGNNAARANRMPRELRIRAGRSGRGCGSLRRRNCSKTAAAPMAEITTTAAGLRNAAGLVKSTTRISAQHSSPDATTVFRWRSAGMFPQTLYNQWAVVSGQWPVPPRASLPRNTSLYRRLATASPSNPLALLHRAVMHGVEHQLHAIGNPQFFEDSEKILLDRVLTQTELGGYVAICQSVRY